MACKYCNQPIDKFVDPAWVAGDMLGYYWEAHTSCWIEKVNS